MTTPTMGRRAGDREVQPAKCDPIAPEVALQELSSAAGPLISQALKKALLTEAWAAQRMGISASLLGRQLQNIDNQHVSFQRLFRLPDAFWRELWVLVAERRKLARVRRRVVFDMVA